MRDGFTLPEIVAEMSRRNCEPRFRCYECGAEVRLLQEADAHTAQTGHAMLGPVTNA